MAKARKRSAPPRTISRPALLVDGSDGEFRGLIHDLRADGLSIGEVAERLHRSGAFITIEANKLAAAGILEKDSDPADGRRVLLRKTKKRRQLLERLAPFQVRVNDVLFERLDAKRFRQLRALARDLVASGDRAVAMLEFLLHEAQAA